MQRVDRELLVSVPGKRKRKLYYERRKLDVRKPSNSEDESGSGKQLIGQKHYTREKFWYTTH